MDILSLRIRTTGRQLPHVACSTYVPRSTAQVIVHLRDIRKVGWARLCVPDRNQIRSGVEPANTDEEIVEYFASHRSRCDADKGCPLSCVVNNGVEGELKLIARPAIAFGSVRDDRFVFGSGSLLDQTTQNPYHTPVRKFKLVTAGAVFAT